MINTVTQLFTTVTRALRLLSLPRWTSSCWDLKIASENVYLQ